MELPFGALSLEREQENQNKVRLHACLFRVEIGTDSAMHLSHEKAYQIMSRLFVLSTARQEAVINAIPLKHQPIFWG